MSFKKAMALMLGLCASLAVSSQETDSIRSVSVEEVTVMASRMGNQLKDLPQKIEMIPGSLAGSLPSDNLAELLKRTTNLDIVQYPGLSATVSMRGFSPSAMNRSYTLILINGVPSGTDNLATISMDNVERVEVVKGPYSVLYGSNAMAGVINIITRQDTGEKDASVSLESGSFGYRRMAGSFGGTVGEKVSFSLGFSHMEQQHDYRIGKHNLLDMREKEKLIVDKKSYGDKMVNSAWELNQLSGILAYRINPLWRFNIQGSYTYAFDVGVPGNYWGTYGQTKKDVDRLNLSAALERNTKQNSLRVSPFFSKELDPNYSDNTDEGFMNFRSDSRDYGFQLQDVQRWGPLSLLGGLDYRVADYESDCWESKGTPTNPYKPDNENANLALFSQLAYTSGIFSMNAGIRYDHFHYQIDANEGLEAPEADEKYGTWNPSVGAQLEFIKNLKFHTSFGTAFAVPDAYQVAGQYSVYEYYPEWDYTWSQEYVGNPELEPEKSRTVDLGLKYASPETGLRLDLTYFYTRHDNKIVETQLGSGEYTYINANEATMDGLELMSSLDMGTLLRKSYKLELYANWTRMFRSELEEKDNTGKTTRDMYYIRRSNGNFGLCYGPRPYLSIRLNGRYIGSRLEQDYYSDLRPDLAEADYYTGGGYTADDKVLELPDYLLFDFSVNYNYNRHVNFGFTVSNLLDDNYTEKDGYNMPGRSVTGKVTYNFNR
ncbi:MAG: TonB-dependent receptor plug domain-containing protein [Mangrovibacterium sp.]